MKNILKAKKENANKGFTLVELIIVVAVIAILATVLAPQYIRYVERSRESNDLQVATTIVRATTVGVADPQLDLPADGDFTITWTTSTDTPTLTVEDGTSGVDTVTEQEADLLESIASVLGWWSTTGALDGVDDAQSAAGSTQNFIFTIAVDTGRVVVDDTNSDGWVDQIGVDSAS